MKKPVGLLFVFFIAMGLNARVRVLPEAVKSEVVKAFLSRKAAVPTHKTKLLLIRHGQTNENALRIVQGHLDVPLSEVGIEEASAIARTIKQVYPATAAIYSSDLKRAYHTAQVIGKALDKKVKTSTDLRELRCGLVEGLSRDLRKALYGEWKDKLDKLHPSPYTRWHFPDWPSGETKFDLLKRVRGVLEQIAQRHKGQLIVIVTHSGVIDTLIMSLKNPHYPIPNCSISHFWYDHSRSENPLTFVKMEEYSGKEVYPEANAPSHL